MKKVIAQHPQARIVVVDDNATNLLLLTELLKLAGFASVTAFSHATEVIPYLQANQVDVLLVDQSMPEVTGLELYLCMKQQLTELPISFLVTAHSMGDLAERATANGMQGFIRKPFTMHQVVNEIDLALTARGNR